MNSLYPIQTDRLLITPSSIANAALQLELMNTDKWIKYIGDRNVHTLTEAENYIAEKMLPQFERLGYGNNVITLKETDESIGCVGIYDRPELEGYDFGFALLPAFEGLGYAYEASKELLKIAKEHFDIKKLGAITTPDNLESQRLLAKLGFTLSKKVMIGGEELMYYELDFDQIS